MTSLLFILATTTAQSAADLPLPILKTAIIGPSGSEPVPYPVDAFMTLSSDGLRGFSGPRTADRDGPSSFEFWPPNRSQLDLVLAQHGSERWVFTGRQWLSYDATYHNKTSKLLLVDSSAIVIAAPDYHTITCLVSARSSTGKASAYLVTLDTDVLGRIPSATPTLLGNAGVSSALVDRTTSSMLYQSNGSWFVQRNQKDHLVLLPKAFEPWALNAKSNMVVGHCDARVLVVNLNSGKVVRTIAPAGSIAAKKPQIMAMALLKSAHVLVSYEYDDVRGKRGAMLFELTQSGILKALGPFRLLGSSVDGSVILLGRAYQNVSRAMIWLK